MLIIILLSVIYISTNQGLLAREIDLNTLVQLSIKRNFEIKKMNHDLKSKKASIKVADGDFDFNLSSELSRSSSDVPTSSSLDGGGSASSVKTDTDTLNITINKKFGHGTSIQLPYNYDVVDSESSFRLIKETHEPSLGVTLTQSLISPFFEGYHKKKSIEASKNYEALSNKNRQKIEKQVFKLINLYYDYKESIQSQKIFQEAVDLANKNLELISQKKKHGKASLVELLDAKNSYNKGLTRLLKEENKSNQLKNKISKEIAMEKNDFKLSSSYDQAKFLVKNIKLLKPSKKTFGNRGDLKEKEINILKYKRKSKFAKVDSLPTVDLEFSYSSKGLQESLSKGNDEVLKAKFPTSKIALSLEYRPMSSAAEGNYEINYHKMKQEEIKRKAIKRDIIIELDNAISDIETQIKINDSLKRSLEVKREKMTFFQKKFNQGMISAYELDKEFESKLSAEVEMVKAINNLDRKIYAFYKSQGLLLSKFLKK